MRHETAKSAAGHWPLISFLLFFSSSWVLKRHPTSFISVQNAFNISPHLVFPPAASLAHSWNCMKEKNIWMNEQTFLIFSKSHAVPPSVQTLLGVGYTNNADVHGAKQKTESAKLHQQLFISG